MKGALWFVTLLLSVLFAMACQSATPSTPEPLPTHTPYPTATPWPMPEPLPTHTPYPTATPWPMPEPLPTHTPYPTATPWPMPEPLPTHTPYPTATPWPMPEPLPTHTPYPTATPWPMPEPLPTHTPYPTATPWPTPEPRVVIERSNWYSADGLGYYVLGKSDNEREWILSVGCSEFKAPYFNRLNPVFGHIYFGDQTEYSGDWTFIVSFDGVPQSQTWKYNPSGFAHRDDFSTVWPESVVRRLLDTDQLVITVSRKGEPYIVTFNVGGLDPGVLCDS